VLKFFFSLLLPTVVFGLTGYICNFTDNAVVLFDIESNTVIGSFPAGTNPADILLNGHRLYVANQTDNTVSVFDTKTNTLISTIPVDQTPVFLGLQDKYLFVVNYGGAGGDGSISVIDIESNAVIHTITSPSFNGPQGIDFARNFAYVPNWGNPLAAGNGNTVTVFDTSTFEVVATLEMGAPGLGCVGVAVRGRYAYVVNNSNPGTVSVIDTYFNTLVDTVPSNNSLVYPWDIAIVQQKAYVSNNGSNTLSVISLKTNEVVQTVVLEDIPGTFPNGVATIGNYIYVTNPGVSTVSVYNLATGEVSLLNDPHSLISGPVYIALPSVAYDVNRIDLLNADITAKSEYALLQAGIN
jgi:YVTN family beta-propeller protein